MKTNYPKIGIRPTIDGCRQGIRESLEEMTMKAAGYAQKIERAGACQILGHIRIWSHYTNNL